MKDESPLDLELFDQFYADQPKYNPLLAEGFGYSQCLRAPEYIAELFRQAEKDHFPKGLKFMGYQPCAPEEAFKVLMSMPRRSQIFYEVSRSDTYMVEFKFSYMGGLPLKESLYLMLPNAQRGGYIQLRDSFFHIAPVIGDIAISVGQNYLFAHTKMKLKFFREYQAVMLNGERRSLNVVWSQINNSRNKQIKSCLMHYLMTKDGLSGTLKKYTKARFKVGHYSEIKRSDYPESEWYICKTASPSHVIRAGNRINRPRTDVAIAVMKEDFDELVAGMIGSFFYIADFFPTDACMANDLEDPFTWKMILGSILIGNEASIGKAMNYIDSHIESVDTYMTIMFRKLLALEGLQVDSIYDLFVEIIATFSRRIAVSSDALSTMYGKCLMVLRYILADVITGINNATFRFSKFKDRAPTEQEVMNVLRECIRLTAAVELSAPEHTTVSTLQSSTDSLTLKLSMPAVLQSNTNRERRGSTDAKFGDDGILHASIAEIGNPNANPSKDPTGRQRLNLYAKVDNNGIIHRREEFIEVIDAIQDNIRR